MKQIAKRLISMILSLTLFATLFASLTINASAASDEWKVYNVHSYYDGDKDYHVVLSYKETEKRILFWKRPYISQIKIDTYVTTDPSGSKHWASTVKMNTAILKKNSSVRIGTCLDYLEELYPDLYNTYQATLLAQETYRREFTYHAHGLYFYQKYIGEFKKCVEEKSKETIQDLILEGLRYPSSLQILCSVSSAQDDIDELKDLFSSPIFDLKQLACDYISLISLNPAQRARELACGAPLVKELLNVANKYTTTSDTNSFFWNSTMLKTGVELAPGIYTITEHTLTMCNDETCPCKGTH